MDTVTDQDEGTDHGGCPQHHPEAANTNRAAGETGLSEIRAHHQGIENLHPVHGWVGPTPFAFLDIGFKIDVSNNQ